MSALEHPLKLLIVEPDPARRAQYEHYFQGKTDIDLILVSDPDHADRAPYDLVVIGWLPDFIGWLPDFRNDDPADINTWRACLLAEQLTDVSEALVIAITDGSFEHLESMGSGPFWRVLTQLQLDHWLPEILERIETGRPVEIAEFTPRH